MITLELAQEFLYEKNTQIFSSSNNWIKDYQVKSIYIRSEFGYDEFIFICQYWDCGLLQTTKCSSKVDQFNSWLECRRIERIGQLGV